MPVRPLLRGFCSFATEKGKSRQIFHYARAISQAQSGKINGRFSWINASGIAAALIFLINGRWYLARRHCSIQISTIHLTPVGYKLKIVIRVVQLLLCFHCGLQATIGLQTLQEIRICGTIIRRLISNSDNVQCTSFQNICPLEYDTSRDVNKSLTIQQAKTIRMLRLVSSIFFLFQALVIIYFFVKNVRILNLISCLPNSIILIDPLVKAHLKNSPSSSKSLPLLRYFLGIHECLLRSLDLTALYFLLKDHFYSWFTK